MRYDILTKIIEITDADLELLCKLKKAARLLVREFPFDACAVYEWNDKEKCLENAASFGGRGRNAARYENNEGLPGRAMKLGRMVEAGASMAVSLDDKGLKGFKSALIIPLKDGKNRFGVLYLKAIRKIKPLTTKEKKLLHVIALQIASSIKSDRYIKSLDAAYGELQDIRVRLVNAEKLMALGELSAALAHEIKTPLVSIGGFASRLKKKFDAASPYYPYVEHITKEVVRLESIVNDILSYANEKTSRFKVKDINSIINETLGVFEEAIKISRITVKKRASNEPLPVMADEEQLKIAFDNLIANAIESMDGGGTLSVSAAKNGDWVVTEIADSGGGIEPGLVSGIFDPFVTTKERGTGLGLPITRKIIMRHRGSIDVVNDYGRGTTFRVKLPSADSGYAAHGKKTL
ncbi:MAG: ATP-binding protein [Thermodesulfobacteriota bacterium]